MMADGGDSFSSGTAFPATSDGVAFDNPFAAGSFSGVPDSFAPSDCFNTAVEGMQGMPPAFQPSTEQAIDAASMLAQNAPALNDLAQSAGNLSAGVQAAAQNAVSAVSTMVAGNSTQVANVPKMQISVTDPVKQGDGFGSYISYKINTRTSLPQYTWKEFSQIHRYSDFVWLHNQLKARYPNVIIPPLPEKALTGNYDPNFISLRRHALERFLNRIASHPLLQTSEDLQTFLEANEETLNAAKRTVAEPKKPAAQQQGGIGRWFKEAMQGVSNSFSAPQEFADPAYDEQRMKIEELKEQVIQLKRYTEKLVMHRRLLSMAHAELGVGFSTYANIEHGHIKNGMAMLGDMCDRVSVLEGEEASVEELQVDSMLTDTVLMLTAVGELCQNRQKAIVSLQTARAIHKEKVDDYEKVKLDQRKAAKAAELMRQIHEAELQEADAKKAYDDLVDSMTEELNRFNTEREADYKTMMLSFAETSREYYKQIAQKWDEAFNQLQEEFASTQSFGAGNTSLI
jgi:sorting nexin-1/2